MRPGKPENVIVAGPAGGIEVDITEPAGAPHAIALIAHPHPLQGGTKDNKVVTTLARAFVSLGCAALRPNFRGVGQTQGVHDEGCGESDDLVAVVQFARDRYGELPLACAGFSFGGFVQAQAANRLAPRQLVLVAPAVGRLAETAVPAETLLIHGERDDVVPLAAVLDWARPRNLPVVVVPGGEHFFHGRLAILQQIVTRYCKSVLS
jgi:uncharacterized protein